MPLYNEPITLSKQKNALPSFTWRNKTYQVTRVLERWRWAGKWWITGVAQRRKYYRVEAKLTRGSGPPRTMEIYQDENGWVLSEIMD